MLSNAVMIFTIVLAVIVLGFFGIILWKVLSGDINLDRLISEDDGKASLSRFQLLLFTFVVAGLFLILSLETGQFVDIPEGVLGLIGISGGSFVISKAVGTSQKKSGGQTPNPSPDTNSGNVAAGDSD